MKSGAGAESVNWLGFPGNQVDPTPADWGDDSVRLACPAVGAWEAGQPSGCCCRARRHLIKISRPQKISHMPVRAFPSHPATASPCRRPCTGRPPSWLTTRCCPLQRPSIFPAPLLVLQQRPHIPTAQRGRPPAEMLGVLQGSVGLLEPDDFWSLAVTGPL